MNAKRLLLITKKINVNRIGGRELLCNLNSRVLEDLLGASFVKFEIPNHMESAFTKATGALHGRIDGLNDKIFSQIAKLVEQRSIKHVFIDGSNLGSVAKALKSHLPSLEITTFYHNVETRFFLGSLYYEKSAKALLILLGNYLAERRATKYSDKIICLNSRDSEVLFKFFGRRATHIFPMALDRPVTATSGGPSQVPTDEFALFVGGNFYANLAGIKWFRDFISPGLSIPLYIVGRGFDQNRKHLEIPGKIVIVGGVDDLEDWYKKSKFVVAPIFDGSGMKTKVAEALMYGKKIIGTPEAFVGYESVLPVAGWSCSTHETFLHACKAAQSEPSNTTSQELVRIFETHYSYAAARNRFRQIL